MNSEFVHVFDGVYRGPDGRLKFNLRPIDSSNCVEAEQPDHPDDDWLFRDSLLTDSSAVELSEESGMSADAIRRIRRKSGVVKKPKKIDGAAVVAKYDGKVSACQVGLEFGISATRVRRIWQVAGKDKMKDREAAALNAYDGRKSASQVGRDIGLSSYIVSRIWLANGKTSPKELLKRAILTAYDGIKTASDVAKELSTTTTTVTKWWRQEGLSSQRMRRHKRKGKS